LEELDFLKDNSKLSLAMAYVPWQKWRDLYPSDVGFDRGTIFKELDMPFIGERDVNYGK
jgi:hypothetical protein